MKAGTPTCPHCASSCCPARTGLPKPSLATTAKFDSVEALVAQVDGDKIARLENYFFNPEFIAEVCEELGVPYRINGYTYC